MSKNKKKKQKKSKIVNINQINKEIQDKNVLPFPKTDDNLIDFSEQIKEIDKYKNLNVLSNKAPKLVETEQSEPTRTEQQNVETDNVDNVDNVVEEKSEDISSDTVVEDDKKNEDEDDDSVVIDEDNTDVPKSKNGILNYFFTFFQDVPAAVADKIKRILLFCAVFCGMCVLMSVLFTFSWITVALAVGMIVYTAIVVWAIKYKSSRNMLVEFNGIVVNCKKIGFGKKFSYFIILIANENNGKMLAFKYNEGSNGIDKGVPVTIYLDKNEPIINSENGPFVEHYVSIMLGFNSSEKLSENKSVSAEDFVNE